MYRVNSKVNTAVWLCKETWYQRHTGDKQKEKPTWNVLERRWSPLATKAASELLCIQSATFSELYWRDEHLSSSRFVLILCFHDGARVLSDMSVQNIDTGCSSVVKVFSKNSKLLLFFFLLIKSCGAPLKPPWFITHFYADLFRFFLWLITCMLLLSMKSSNKGLALQWWRVNKGATVLDLSLSPLLSDVWYVFLSTLFVWVELLDGVPWVQGSKRLFTGSSPE